MRPVLQRVIAVAALCSAALASSAFSSAAWMARRNDDGDLHRLQGVYKECLKQVKLPAENVIIPVENFPDGRVKTQIRAAKAQFFLETGYVWAADIHVEQYRPDGKLDGTLVADNCVIDRRTQSGWVQGRATLHYGGSTIKGRGIYFSFRDQFIKILADSEIRTKGMRPDTRRIM